MLSVSKDSKGQFHTISEALSSIADDNQIPVTIFVFDGTYSEKLIIDKPFITIEGESIDRTIITFQDYARMLMPNGEKRGTFRTSTVFINTHDFTARNLTICNTSGLGSKVGQAIALYVDGDHIIFDHCRIIASQDTLFTGPLPPYVMEKNGFVGPKEFSPRINGHHYYKKCYISGDVDFIFGSATAYFEDCEIYSQKGTAPVDISTNTNTYGYITAASTAEGQSYGYIFYQCNFTSNCPPKTVYLGRPWRNYAKVILIDCELGPHIKDEGWHDWNKEDAHNTILFAEYGSKGEGSVAIAEGKRVPWSKQLTELEASSFTKEHVLAQT